jgi:H/ACA ribonucleoprotein complex subunit 4
MENEEDWIVDSSAKTNHSFGCIPSERPLEDLLECGVILVDKPPGPSSHQLAAWARSMLGINRIGHGGTLDPFATGLLTLLCGRSTKITGEILKKPKSYVAVIRFKKPVGDAEICDLVSQMQGEIYNVPPKESAVKIQVRTREVSKSALIQSEDGGRVHLLSINCEAGTYIRTLVRDLGLLSGNECELLELHRSTSGSLDDQMACSMQQLADAVFLWREHDDPRGLSRLLSPVETVLGDIPNIVIKDGAVSALSHGAPLARPGIVSTPRGLPNGSMVLLSSLKGEAVAIAELSVSSDSIPGMKSGQVATPRTVIMQPGAYPQTWSKE